MEFEAFPKMARLSRKMIVTEKIDGTNAQVCISEDCEIRAGSRTRWITPEDDNFGFAAWVRDNRNGLLALGPGRHFGEWWGKGIQRGYGLTERRFSLFNATRWTDDVRPACCHVVPILWRGEFDTAAVSAIIESMREQGSAAAPGFTSPEGVIVFHTGSNSAWKKTLEKDELPKTLAQRIAYAA